MITKVYRKFNVESGKNHVSGREITDNNFLVRLTSTGIRYSYLNLRFYRLKSGKFHLSSCEITGNNFSVGLALHVSKLNLCR